MSLVKRISGLASVLFFILVSFSCSMPESNTDIEIKGIWQLSQSGTGWSSTEKWEITNDFITYSADYGTGFSTTYIASIVYYDNLVYNGGETTITDSVSSAPVNSGYAVIQYWYVDGAGTGEVGKYNILRWDIGADGTASFTQGYKNVGAAYPNNVNGVKNTYIEAIAGILNSTGYFSVNPSSGAVRLLNI